MRVRITGWLGEARIPAQVDIGFGDVLVDVPIEADLPVPLEYPRPRLRAYNAEASIAEKLEAMVRFGARNSRMKDYFDVFVLSREREFDGPALVRQISATFARRETRLPASLPTGLRDRFGADRRQDWTAFLTRSGGQGVPEQFPEVVARVRDFAYPPLRAAANEEPFAAKWTPDGRWETGTPRRLAASAEPLRGKPVAHVGMHLAGRQLLGARP